jgi:small subunit ribosomal protein S6
MKDYELLYIVSGGLTEGDATKATDEVGQALVKLGGKATDENVWGRRKLAYPIGKDDHGWYVVTRFSMEPAKLDEFSKALNLNRQVIRTVLLTADEVPSPEEVKKAQEAAEAAEKEEAEERAAKKSAPGVSAKTSTATAEIPEELKKSAAKAADKPEPKAEADEGEKPVDQKQLDEKLGEILKD